MTDWELNDALARAFPGEDPEVDEPLDGPPNPTHSARLGLGRCPCRDCTEFRIDYETLPQDRSMCDDDDIPF